VVAYLGQLKETERRGVRQAAEGKRRASSYEQLRLFDEKRRWKKEVIDRPIGRIMAQNSRAAKLFQVEVKQVADRAVVSWTKDEAWRDWAALSEGCYTAASLKFPVTRRRNHVVRCRQSEKQNGWALSVANQRGELGLTACCAHSAIAVHTG